MLLNETILHSSKTKGDKNASFGLMGKFTTKKIELHLKAVFGYFSFF